MSKNYITDVDIYMVVFYRLDGSDRGYGLNRGRFIQLKNYMQSGSSGFAQSQPYVHFGEKETTIALYWELSEEPFGML